MMYSLKMLEVTFQRVALDRRQQWPCVENRASTFLGAVQCWLREVGSEVSHANPQSIHNFSFHPIENEVQDATVKLRILNRE